jgi:hypothetical protein
MVKYALIFAAFLVACGTIYEVGRSHGGASVRADIAKEVRKKLNAAQTADDATTRCLADPQCRMSNDGYRRD